MQTNLLSRPPGVIPHESAHPLSSPEGGRPAPGVTAAPPNVQNPNGDDFMQRVSRIVRRHAHDVRNHLNVLDFDATLLGALTNHPEATAILQRMRTGLNQLEAAVKALGLKFEAPRPVLVAAEDLLHLWKLQVRPLEKVGSFIEWSATQETEPVNVDPNGVVAVLRELTVAAWGRAGGLPLKASVRANGAVVVLELREPANGVPMSADLIEESARFIEANGGRLVHMRNPATEEWITTLTFAGSAL